MTKSGSGRPQVVITQRVHPGTLELLSPVAEVTANDLVEPWSRETLLQYARTAQALMVFMPDSIDEALLEACPNLKVIAAALKGYDSFDIDACRRRGIWFTIVPDLLTQPTAELALTLLLALARNVRSGDEHVRSGAFAGWRPVLYGATLAGSTVGLIGYGAVGKAFERLIGGFDCHMIWSDLKPGGLTLEQVACESDFLLPLLPLTSQTLHLIDAKFLAKVKRGAFLINVGRGSVVDEEAVADALSSGQLSGYAADVFEMEDWQRPDRPRAIPERLLRYTDRTLFTPHLGSATRAARREIERSAALSILDVLCGRTPRNALFKVPGY